MKEYMVEFAVTVDVSSQAFLALLPKEQERVQELLENGTFKNVWLKEDLSGGYTLAYVESKQVLEEVLDSLPLKEFLEFTVTALKENHA